MNTPQKPNVPAPTPGAAEVKPTPYKVHDPAKAPTGLAPDRDVKQRTLDANTEAKAQYEAIKDKVTLLYPLDGQKVHNPVTCNGACQLTDVEQKDTVIEVRVHNKVARAEIAGGKWSAHFDVLPTGLFDFDLYVNGFHHCSAKAEVSM